MAADRAPRPRGRRCRSGATGGALVVGLAALALALGAGSASAAPPALSPTLDCVADSGGGLLTAYFGYVNSTSQTVDVGDANEFIPGAQFQGQPTTFDVGSYPDVVSVAFDPAIVPAVTWILSGQTATATADSPPCLAGSTGPASAVTPTSATVNALVDPRGATTTYHFDYGTTSAYGQSTAAQTTDGSDPSIVSAALADLAPGTTYHYRLVATNAMAGTTDGQDETFTTPALPAPSPPAPPASTPPTPPVSTPPTPPTTTPSSPPAPADAELALAVRHAPRTGRRGRPLTYVFTVVNRGPSTATGVTFAELPAAGETATRLSGRGVACDSAHGQQRCALGDLAPGARAIVVARVLPHVTGTLRDVALVLAAQPDPAVADAVRAVSTRIEPGRRR